MGHPAYVRNDGGISVMAMVPRVSERGTERLTGTEEDGNAVSCRSHLAEIGEGEEGDSDGQRCPRR